MRLVATTLLTIVLLAPSTAFSQTRNRSTSRQKPTATATQRVSQVRTAGATRLADEIKSLSTFMYLLGGINNGFATVEEAERRKEATPALLQKNQENKAIVRSSIQNVRVRLDKLETDFRATPELQPYYIKLAGSAAGAATAEEQAAANQFERAGRTLLTVINRLTDVLLLMRTTD